MTPAIIMGGILGGIFTPTEASVVACAYALVLGMAVYRELKWRDLPRILLETANQTAQVMFIVATAGLFGWFLIYMRVPDALIQALTALSANKWAVLAIINVILLVLGCFMEGIAIMLLTVPIFMPIVAQARDRPGALRRGDDAQPDDRAAHPAGRDGALRDVLGGAGERDRADPGAGAVHDLDLRGAGADHFRSRSSDVAAED